VAFVQGVLPIDPKRPRILRLVLDPIARTANDYAEFDTEESAQDWRREVTGVWRFLSVSFCCLMSN
jgi:sterol 3beta-glucosyltransferase